MSALAREIALPVSLAEWTVTASIDYLTLTNLSNDRRRTLRSALAAHDARVKLAQDGGREVITVHDPGLTQLQQIIDIYPNASIYAAEFSVDLRPVGKTDISELTPVFKWFADVLYPALPRAKRYMYQQHANGKGRYVKVPDEPCDRITTIIWRDTLERVKQRLYIKQHDGNGPFDRPCVRLETTLSMAGCSDVGLAKAWQLATFGGELRRVLSPCFQIADAIKPSLKRARHKPGSNIGNKTIAHNERELVKTLTGWRKGGAMWAANRGYQVSPHREANRRIGDALHRLGKQLTKLKPPENSRETFELVAPENRMLLEVDDFRASAPIRGKPVSYPYRKYMKKEI